MIPLFEYEGRAWFPFGMPMSQNRMALPTWSYAMETHPPKTIIEIGTNSGGFTCVLGIHAWRIGCKIHTFDVCDAPTLEFLPLANILPITFHKMDCFTVPAMQLITDLIRQSGVTYVMCDGGNKLREMETFSTFLKPGDVIAAHDYSTPEKYWGWNEISMDQVRETISKQHLKPFMQEHFDMAGWIAFQKE